jgi:uncharacterized protein (UPF0332 family)
MSRYSAELLAQAGMLVRREPRRPKQASLRRSISASYYSLFHFLIEETTRLAVGTAHNRTGLRNFAARAFAHGKMKSVCDEFIRETPRSNALKPFWEELGVWTNSNLKTIAENFIELQEARHDADYNLARRFTRQDAGMGVGQAKDAMDAWQRLKAANEPLASLFALSLILWPGLAGR